ncbi:MAG: hypothetical protein HQM13_22365 [SAR324 cluster bacterium]|nr:hypothetical protein [SAR324 cluster bacterium]
MTKTLLGEGKYYELQVYRGDGNLEQEAIPFSGVLRQHYNPNIVLLLNNSLYFRKRSLAFEIRVDDILHVEELPAETAPDGVTVEKVKLWVKKGSTIVKMEPIVVSDEIGNESKK